MRKRKNKSGDCRLLVCVSKCEKPESFIFSFYGRREIKWVIIACFMFAAFRDDFVFIDANCTLVCRNVNKPIGLELLENLFRKGENRFFVASTLSDVCEEIFGQRSLRKRFRAIWLLMSLNKESFAMIICDFFIYTEQVFLSMNHQRETQTKNID